MIGEITTIVGNVDGEIFAGHKLIEAQLEYVFEEDGKLYRTSLPLTRGGSVIVVVVPDKAGIVGIPEGEVASIEMPEGHQLSLETKVAQP